MLWDESTDDLILAGAAKLYLYEAGGGENLSSSGSSGGSSWTAARASSTRTPRSARPSTSPSIMPTPSRTGPPASLPSSWRRRRYAPDVHSGGKDRGEGVPRPCRGGGDRGGSGDGGLSCRRLAPGAAAPSTAVAAPSTPPPPPSSPPNCDTTRAIKAGTAARSAHTIIAPAPKTASRSAGPEGYPRARRSGTGGARRARPRATSGSSRRRPLK